MIKPQNSKELDFVFEALSNQHRRELVYVLGLQPQSISQLAEMRDLSLPAVHKHIKVLLRADIIKIKKIGRTRFIVLNRKSLLRLQEWLGQYHAYWGNEEENLENYAKYLSQKKKGGEK